MRIAVVLAALIAATPAHGMPEAGANILANTIATTRQKGRDGFAKPVYGRIYINGHTYPFVSGGRGRGAAPFGRYKIGKLGGFRTPKGTFIPGFPLSNAYDPFAQDTRTGLFIHPGHHASAGCFAIEERWSSFVRDMLENPIRTIFLGHERPEPFTLVKAAPGNHRSRNARLRARGLHGKVKRSRHRWRHRA